MLASLGQWRQAGKPIPGDALWKALRNAPAIEKSLRGEPLTSATLQP
jgi:hypothetical protein